MPALLCCRDGERGGGPAPASSTSSIEITTITARSLAGQLVKCSAERARLAETDIERDPSYGQLTIGQKLLGPLDSAIGMISVRRHAKGTLE